jgi:hypothetical protein
MLEAIHISYRDGEDKNGHDVMVRLWDADAKESRDFYFDNPQGRYLMEEIARLCLIGFIDSF